MRANLLPFLLRLKEHQEPKGKPPKKENAYSRQTDLFSGAMQQPYTPPVPNGKLTGQAQTAKTGSIGDLFSQKTEMAKLISQPFPYYCHSRTCPIQWELQSFHRNDCLVVDNGWVGYLQEVDKENGTAIFHPLQLPSAQKARAEAYIGT
jgi:hypothetical protein